MVLAVILDRAFENAGVPGSYRLGGYYVYDYPYAVIQAYCVALPNPIDWPPPESVIMDATTGTVICRAAQLRIKGFVAAGVLQMRLYLNISGWDLVPFSTSCSYKLIHSRVHRFPVNVSGKLQL